LAHFGRWVFLSTLLTFLAVNSDRLIFGKVLPMGKLGVYGIAAIWATMPSGVLGRIFGAVAFPLLSRAKNLGEPIGPVFRDTREKVMLVGAWLTSGLIAGAAPLVRLLYDRRASDAIWIIPLLAVGGWFAALENTNSNAALSLGKPKWLAAANGAKVVGMATVVPLGAVLGGFPGAIMGLTLSDGFKYLVSAIGAVRLGVSGWRQDIVLSLGIAAVSACAMGVRHLVGAEQFPAVLDALLVTILATAAWAPIWLMRATHHTALAKAEAAAAALASLTSSAPRPPLGEPNHPGGLP
jgi:O-antigen/teichoic acid export membrane protein